jgi:5-amino-6-(5-phosphoribosylamino)uracil reductase
MRPFVLLKTAISIDGYLDDVSAKRCVFSGPEDAEEVDLLRAESDAILVGAGTIRSDNPNLIVRSEKLCDARVAEGKSRQPRKVTLSCSGNLDAKFSFFTTAAEPPLVFAPRAALEALHLALGDAAEVISQEGPRIELSEMLLELRRRGIRRLLVEGGAECCTMFLRSGLVDELRLAVAPVFIGQPQAPSLVTAALPDAKAQLREVREVGSMTVLTYYLT